MHQSPLEYASQLFTWGDRGVVWVAHNVVRVLDLDPVLPNLLIDANPELHDRLPFRSCLVFHAVVLLRGKRYT